MPLSRLVGKRACSATCMLTALKACASTPGRSRLCSAGRRASNRGLSLRCRFPNNIVGRVNVGGGLPPIAADQLTIIWLTHCYRGQAPSHRRYVVPVRMALTPTRPRTHIHPHRQHQNAAFHNHLPVAVHVQHRHAVIQAGNHQRPQQCAIYRAGAAAH